MDGSTEESEAMKARRVCLDMLMAKFGIDAAMVNVPKLARALGMGSSTIYAYMRAGTFFLPFRSVNGTPMVRVDDLIDWYVGNGGEAVSGGRAKFFDAGLAIKARLPTGDDGAAGCKAEASALVGAVKAKRGRRPISPSALGSCSASLDASQFATKEGADRALEGLAARILSRMEREKAARTSA